MNTKTILWIVGAFAAYEMFFSPQAKLRQIQGITDPTLPSNQIQTYNEVLNTLIPLQ